MTAVFVCPLCGAESYHPTDLAEGYCGRCHDFTARPIIDAPGPDTWPREETR